MDDDYGGESPVVLQRQVDVLSGKYEMNLAMRGEYGVRVCLHCPRH